MEETDITRKRKEELLNEFALSINHHRKWQRANHYASIFFMGASIASSFVAPFLGVIGADKMYVSVTALLPGLVVGLASAFNNGGRAEWNDKRKNGVNELRRRLLYEVPDPPSIEDIASISVDWAYLDRLNQKELARDFTFRPGAFGKITKRTGAAGE